jgi:hypothetical protein
VAYICCLKVLPRKSCHISEFYLEYFDSSKISITSCGSKLKNQLFVFILKTRREKSLHIVHFFKKVNKKDYNGGAVELYFGPY